MLKTADVVFEDREILVLDKKAGVVVNKSATIDEFTLQDDLFGYFRLGRGSLGIGERAGIVHRLDRETSGLLVVAKTEKAFENLQDQFKQRGVKKTYKALVHRFVKQDAGSIDAQIVRVGSFGKFGIAGKRQEGKEANTDFAVEKRLRFGDEKFEQMISKLVLAKPRINYLKEHAMEYTYLFAFPKTGRTHQIRVHLKSIGHPVVCDLIYDPRKLLKFDLVWCPRIFLHAAKLEFDHPKTKKRVEFKSELPNDLKEALACLTINN